MTFTELQNKYKALNVAEKLIAINVIIFLFVQLISALFKSRLLIDNLTLDASIDNSLFKPWSILTYAFMHHNMFHLLIHMVMLYFVARFFFSVFNKKLFLNVYFLGAIAGAVVFLIAGLAPSFLPPNSILLGSSAAVTAVLIFVCASFPNQKVSVLTIKLSLWHIGALLIAVDVFQLLGENRGGHVAHLGGALLGYLYATQYAKGNDIGSGFEKMMDTVSSWFLKQTKPKMKTVHKTRRQRNSVHKTVHQKDKEHQEKTNIILDKISKSGYDSLTAIEKEFLFKSGKK